MMPVFAVEARGVGTLCVLVLRNGFLVTGESACVDLANFNSAAGRRYARECAVGKLWQLLGYTLKDQLHRDAINRTPGGDSGTAENFS